MKYLLHCSFSDWALSYVWINCFLNKLLPISPTGKLKNEYYSLLSWLLRIQSWRRTWLQQARSCCHPAKIIVTWSFELTTLDFLLWVEEIGLQQQTRNVRWFNVHHWTCNCWYSCSFVRKCHGKLTFLWHFCDVEFQD